MDDALAGLDRGGPEPALGVDDRLRRAGGGVPVGADAAEVGVEAGAALLEHVDDPLGHVEAVLLHAGHAVAHADGVPALEDAEVPVEAPAHGPIDVDDVVSDLWDPVGAVDEGVCRDGPGELAGLVVAAQQGAHGHLRVVLEGQGLLDAVEAGAGLRRVLAGAPVTGQGDASALLVPLLGALVEALAGLVAQGALGEEGLVPVGALVGLALLVVGTAVEDVSEDVIDGVEADEIGEAEDAELGTAGGLAQGRVDLLDGHVEALHVPEHADDPVGADAVGDEVGGVLGGDDALAELLLAEAGQSLGDLGQGVGAAHELEQPHVADGVEEVGDDEVLPHLFRHAGGHVGQGQARGVAGHDAAGATVGCHPLEDLRLDVEALDHHLDDEVTLGEQAGVVVVVGGGEHAGQALLEEGGGLELGGVLDAVDGQLGARGTVGQVAGHDVEEHAGHAGVGEVGGDALPHDAGSEHGDLADLLGHEVLRPPELRLAGRLNEGSFSGGCIADVEPVHPAGAPWTGLWLSLLRAV